MAEYLLFPNEKEAEFKQECEEELEKLKDKIDGMRKKKKKTEKSSEEDTAEAMGVMGLSMLIAAVPALFVCVSVCNANSKGNWTSGFPALVGGIFAMALTFFVVTMLMGSIFAKIYKKKENKKEAKNNQIELDIIEEKKTQTEIENTFRDKAAAYKKAFYNEADQRTTKFAGNPITDEIIEWIAGVMCGQIDGAGRSEQTAMVQKVLNYQVTESQVTTDFGSYVFQSHRISNLSDAAEAMGLAKAIGTGVQAELLARFPMDPLGTPVRVNVAYIDEEHKALARITYHSQKEEEL